MPENLKSIQIELGDGGVRHHLRGREAWAIACLIEAGERGCTPIDHPGPRWSDYCFKLRRRGIAVETVTERHGGPYRGTHARYVLRSHVTVLAREAA
jgi:hypothetical protein